MHGLGGGYKPSPICFYGGPGTGKTSLLKYAQDALLKKNWICGYSEASPDKFGAIDDFLEDIQRTLPRGKVSKRFASRLTEINVSVAGIGAGVKLGEASSRTAYSRVRDLFSILGEIAKKSSVGVVFLIDEDQTLPRDDLRLLFRVINNMDRHPVSLIVAGLPGISRALFGAEDRGGREESGPEVKIPPILSPLRHTDARQALAMPIEEAGGSIDQEGLNLMTDFAEGHPLTLRMLGGAAWEIADNYTSAVSSVLIKTEHAITALESVQRQLRIAYYEPMWRRSNSIQRDFMIELASTGGKAYAPEVILNIDRKRFSAGLPYSNIEDVLDDLACMGIIDYSGYWTHFSIPGFAAYVQAKAASPH